MHRLIASLATVILLSSAPAALAQPAPVFTTEDMLAVRTFAGGQPVAVSSDGRRVAYVLTDIADEWNIQEPRPTGHVVVQTLAGDHPGAPRALTTGTTHSSFPVWSPDGRRLAFIREDSSGGRVVVWDAERDALTPVGEPFTARAYLAPQWDPKGGSVIAAVPVADRQAPPYRVRAVKSTDARIPGDQFFTDERGAVLTAIDAGTGKAAALAAEPIVLRSFRVSPTGRDLLFVTPDPATLGVIGKEQNDTFVLPIAGARPAPPRKLAERGRFTWAPDGTRLLFARGGRLLALPLEGGPAVPWRESFTLPASDPIWSPDGTRFAALIADPMLSDPEIEPVKPGMYTIAQPFMDLYVVSADGTSRNVTSDVDDQISDPVWAPDGSAVYFRAVNSKSYDETLYKYTPADQKRQRVIQGPESYGRLVATSNGVVVPVEDATHPDDLWLADGGRRTRITDLNPTLARFTFSKPEMFWYFNADGERLGALLYKPAGLRSGDKVPVITWVYEKMTPAIHRFNARDQMFISHGYAMLMPNVKIKVGQTADSYEKCVIPAVNAVREMGFTTGRFGLWGHSFGAYATSNLITRTSIFAAAVSGATPPELFRNWASGRDRDSRNIETGQARMGGSPFEYPERYLSQSAFFHLDRVTTPVLILHGEKDLTILFGEGEMMFYALRQLGKTAEFVAYANGDHSLSRHSRADALDVNRRILEWFDRYLKPADAPKTP
ncbi:MAG TPA: prolyl oligopeptidase family serine peptidase [Vicinamibacterales bacterium]|nr:prolyl oligopeptidase family serine peptidase [Vicinamibacterales bacterium]